MINILKYLSGPTKLEISKCSFRPYSSGGPLSGIRVLDFSRILAGPFATMILGDLGAQIIKVEKPHSGDDTRSWGPPFINGESCYFLSVNRNKKSIAIDLKRKEGVDIIKKIVKKSDILLENFLPGVMEKLGLGYEDLKVIAPHLIYASITGYGRTGPYKNRAGFDVLAASMGGLLEVTGPNDGEPCKVGVAMTDLATGLYMHGAILAALIERNSTSKGQRIDNDLLSTQVACMVNLASNYLNAGMNGKRRGTEHESIVPYQAFKTKDGYMTVGAGNDRQFNSLCITLNLHHLSLDNRYKTNELRVKNRENLIKSLSDRFIKKTNREWLEIFNNSSSFAFGPINNLEETFSDPQVIHNNMVRKSVHSTTGNIKVVGPPVKYSESVNKVRSPPPTLGQHTDEVLKDIAGYSNMEIEELKYEGIIQVT